MRRKGGGEGGGGGEGATHYISCREYFFQLNTQKGTAEVPTVDLLRLNTLKSTRHFYMGVP